MTTQRLDDWRIPLFWSKVNKDGPVHPVLGTPCWLWTGALNKGYGAFSVAPSRARGAHIVSWELTHGPVPYGHQLDHLCHTHALGCSGGLTCAHRACVNPEHEEPVTSVENFRRGKSLAAQKAQQTHCANGHEFTPDNTRRETNGTRRCRECNRAWSRQRSVQKKGVLV